MTHWYPKSLPAACLAVGLMACGAKSPEASLEKAQEALSKQDRQTAIVLLKAVVQEKPELTDARLLLGKTLLETGDAVGAAAQYEAALRQGSNAEAIALPRARAQLMQGQFKLALDTLESLVPSPAADSAEWHYLKAMALVGLAKPKNAEESALTALKLDPSSGETKLLLARIALVQGRADAALEILNQFEASRGQEAEKRTMLALATVAAGAKADEIRKAYEAVLEVAPDSIEALTGLTGLYLREDKLDLAKAKLETIRHKHPKDLRGTLLGATLALREGHLAKAREGVSEVLKRQPDDLGALTLAGQIAIQDRDWTMAETHFGKALALSPDAIDLRAVLARVYFEQGNSEKALATALPRLSSGSTSSELLSIAAMALLERGQPAQASALFEKARSAKSNDDERLKVAVLQSQLGVGDHGLPVLNAMGRDQQQGVTALLALLSNQLRRGQVDEALATAKKLEVAQPAQAMPHHLQGQMLLSKGDAEAARLQLERAIKLQPEFMPSLHMLAALDLARGAGLAAAQARYEPLLKKQPKHVEARLALANLSLRTGDEAQALARLKALVADAPDELPAHIALIQHQAAMSRMAAAEQEALAGLKQLPDRPELLDLLGRAQFSAGKYDAALQTFRKLGAIQPRSPLPLMRQADALAAKGSSAEAAALLADASKLAPRDPDVQRAQVMLAIGSKNYEAATTQARVMQASPALRLQGLILEGDIELARQRWREAVSVYKKALDQAGSLPEVAIKTHQALQRLSASEAESFASNWANRNPGGVAFHVYMGNQHAATGDYAKAEAAFARALSAQPDSTVFANNVAWARLKQGRTDGIGLLQSAIARDPLNADARDTLAAALELSGKHEQALSMQLEALRLAPGNAAIRLRSVAMLHANKRDAEARKELQTLNAAQVPAALRPEFERLVAALKP